MPHVNCLLLLVGLAVVLALLVTVWSTSLWAYVHGNLGLIHFVKAVDCPASSFVCRTVPFVLRTPTTPREQNHLAIAARWLDTRQKWSSAVVMAQLHTASIQYVQGNRAAAAATLQTLQTLGASLPDGRSPLLTPTRAEYWLVQAQQYLHDKQWHAAVDSFRQATILDPYSLQPVDDKDWYRALANAEMAKAEASLGDAYPAYLVGKYQALAGDFSAAIPWLEMVRSSSTAVQFTEAERGWLAVYLAQALWASDQLDRARCVLDEELARAPDFRPALIELWTVTQAQGDLVAAQQVEVALQSLGPTYRLGQHAEGFAADASVRLDSGWTLIGYEVDEQVLEQASAVALTLWWESPPGVTPAAGFQRTGKYWLQRQTVRNLFANAGFEWGVDEHGIPVGHAREYYGVPPSNLQVIAADLNGEPTQVLAGSTTASHDRVALLSFPVPVDGGGYYLMAAWQQDRDRLSRVGRLCVERRFGPDVGYYVYPDRNRPSQTWVYVADLAPASPDRSPISCSAFLLNSNSKDTALWDRVLFARVEAP